MIFVPLSTMQKILSGEDYLSTICLSVTDKEKMSAVKELATLALLEKHRVAEADFSIISQEDILGTLTTVIDTFTLFLAVHRFHFALSRRDRHNEYDAHYRHRTHPRNRA